MNPTENGSIAAPGVMSECLMSRGDDQQFLITNEVKYSKIPSL